MVTIYYKNGELDLRRTVWSVGKYYVQEYRAGRKPSKPVIASGDSNIGRAF